MLIGDKLRNGFWGLAFDSWLLVGLDHF